ncbi:MAG TPA: hypothetical protein VGI82_04570 [Chitinophagaceae bacterium]|jgi:hypothetical protein
MKKSFFLSCMIFLTLGSCRQFDNHIDIAYNDSDHFFSMKAHFPRDKTRRVEECMDNYIRGESNSSFVNTRIDGHLSLNDHTQFYIRKYPGFLQIKLDKTENSYDSYAKIKSMCEKLKNIITN